MPRIIIGLYPSELYPLENECFVEMGSHSYAAVMANANQHTAGHPAGH